MEISWNATKEAGRRRKKPLYIQDRMGWSLSTENRSTALHFFKNPLGTSAKA
jgi:hypothetical protein